MQKIGSLFLFLLILLGIMYAQQIKTGSQNFLNTDYGKIYQGMQFHYHHQSIYSRIYVAKTTPQTTSEKINFRPIGALLDPPFFEQIILPLGLLKYSHSYILWSLIQIACGLFSIFLLTKSISNSTTPSLILYLAGITALFIYFPTFANLQYGQVTLFMLPLEIMAWRYARNNQSVSCAILLGILASIKFFFGLFLIYFICRREWLALLWFISTILICLLLPIILFGEHVYADYFYILRHVYWYASSWNASYLGFFVRLLGGFDAHTPLISLPKLSYPLYFLTALATLFSLIKFILHHSAISFSDKTDQDFSIVLVCMLLLSPLAWLYYFPFLCIAFVTLSKAPSLTKLDLRWLLTASLAFSGIPHIFHTAQRITPDNVVSIFLLASCYFLCLLILLSAFLYWRFSAKFYAINLNSLKKDSIFFWVIGLLPSLFGIIWMMNTTLLFGANYLPDFNLIYFGSTP